MLRHYPVGESADSHPLGRGDAEKGETIGHRVREGAGDALFIRFFVAPEHLLRRIESIPRGRELREIGGEEIRCERARGAREDLVEV